MNTIQRLAILFASVLLVSTTAIVASRTQSPMDWLLILNRNTQEISILNPETETPLPLTVLPHNDKWIQWVSPNGKWLYFFAQRKLWAYNLLTEDLREIVPCIDSCYDVRNYLSSQGEMIFLFEDTFFRRLDSNTASFIDLEVDMPDFDTVFRRLYRNLLWIDQGEGFYVHWHGSNYRISYDGATVEPFDGIYRFKSPDVNWEWFREGGGIYIQNLADSTTKQVPIIPDTNVYLNWRLDNSLIVRYEDRDHRNTIAHFKEGEWKTLVEEELAYGTPLGVFSPLSPDYSHFMFFGSKWNLSVINLSSGAVSHIGEAMQGHMWNENGDWFVYTKSERRNRISLNVFDVRSYTGNKLYEFTLPGYVSGFKQLPGTDYFVWDWESLSDLGDVLINVKTGQTFELDPDVEVISKWNAPTFPSPRYDLHILIALLLISTPLAAKVARRKLSA